MRVLKMFDEEELKPLPYIVHRPIEEAHVTIHTWLKEKCEGQYSSEIWHICFELESDMILFKLRFG